MGAGFNIMQGGKAKEHWEFCLRSMIGYLRCQPNRSMDRGGKEEKIYKKDKRRKKKKNGIGRKQGQYSLGRKFTKVR